MSELAIAQELRQTAKGLREDAAWLSEDFSLALAEWLEAEAHMVDHRGLSAESHTFHALKVARAVPSTAGEVPR